MKIHRNKKEYECPYCPKSFNQRVAFNMHVRIHTGVKPHKCIECGKRFSRKMLLKQHMRTHSGEKPYQCAVCGKSFADRSNMTLHHRLHSGKKFLLFLVMSSSIFVTSFCCNNLQVLNRLIVLFVPKHSPRSIILKRISIITPAANHTSVHIRIAIKLSHNQATCERMPRNVNTNRYHCSFRSFLQLVHQRHHQQCKICNTTDRVRIPSV